MYIINVSISHIHIEKYVLSSYTVFWFPLINPVIVSNYLQWMKLGRCTSISVISKMRKKKKNEVQLFKRLNGNFHVKYIKWRARLKHGKIVICTAQRIGFQPIQT